MYTYCKLELVSKNIGTGLNQLSNPFHRVKIACFGFVVLLKKVCWPKLSASSLALWSMRMLTHSSTVRGPTRSSHRYHKHDFELGSIVYGDFPQRSDIIDIKSISLLVTLM